MAFKYNVVDIEALMALPVKCKCTDKKQSEAMKQGILNIWLKQENKKILIKGKEYELKEVE